MENEATKLMLAIPDDIAEKAETLKKKLFCQGKTYAEMYYQLIQLGMDEVQKWRENDEKYPR